MGYLGNDSVVSADNGWTFYCAEGNSPSRTSSDSISGSSDLGGKCEETDEEQGPHVSIKFLICLIVTCLCFIFYPVLLFNEFDKLLRSAAWITLLLVEKKPINSPQDATSPCRSTSISISEGSDLLANFRVNVDPSRNQIRATPSLT
jgi:hypothetical protein